LFPVGEEIRKIVADWVTYLREDKLWGNDDPLFPATRVALGATRQFEASGLEREHWSSASPIRTIFREAFVSAGLPYFNPHSVRSTLVQLGQEICKSPEQFKAWSQNLGHEKVLTTFLNYGEVACQRQGEIIRGLAAPQEVMQSDPWSSPAYNHCMFTARPDLDPERERRFTQALSAMSYDNPVHRPILDAEGLQRWLPPHLDGYAELRQAAGQQGFFEQVLAKSA
jgi:hypothetical protein